jgi:two-component system nitrogen regulation sensor histidine kinase NtrY
MASRRGLATAAGQLALFGAGVLAVLAWRNGFYANAMLMVMAGAWIGAVAVLRARAAAESQPTAKAADPPSATSEGPAKWRAFIDQTPAPLIALQPDGVLRAVNLAARAMFATDDRLIDPPGELLAGLQASEVGEMRTLLLPTPTGPRAFALSSADVAAEDGVTRLGVLVDIQSELHAAEAKALRELLSVLSHEIMNSLTPVASLAETAAEYLEAETSASAQAARDALAVLSRRAAGLARFVEGYRTLARLPPPAPRSTNLSALLLDIAEVFRIGWEPRGVRLAFEAPPPDLALELDPDLLTQALLNVLTNAAEAAGEASASPEVRLSARADGGRAEILVEDNGPGVPEDLRESIFQPFVTTKPRGGGIGLNLARQIALSHGGDLAILPPTPGGGARFRFVL